MAERERESEVAETAAREKTFHEVRRARVDGRVDGTRDDP